MFGIYDRDKIPIYIVQAVQEIEHPSPKWKPCFTQRLIVKHNRAPQAPATIPELRVRLLDIEGHVLQHDVLHQPQPKQSEFFETITVTVPHEDISGEQVPALAPAHPMQVRVESARVRTGATLYTAVRESHGRTYRYVPVHTSTYTQENKLFPASDSSRKSQKR